MLLKLAEGDVAAAFARGCLHSNLQYRASYIRLLDLVKISRKRRSTEMRCTAQGCVSEADFGSASSAIVVVVLPLIAAGRSRVFFAFVEPSLSALCA